MRSKRDGARPRRCSPEERKELTIGGLERHTSEAIGLQNTGHGRRSRLLIASPPPQMEFTVFTATYNRAHLLHRVYDSLMAQTFRDFEWLVVDDGSTDGTRALIEAWGDEADFPIRYYYQENQGKHVAYNHAVPGARGRFFLTLDSDDACVPHALERLKHYWDTIPHREKPKFSAVTVLCMDEGGSIVGDRFPHRIIDSDSLELQYRFKIRGEKWGFQRTDVMRDYPFPVPDQKLSHIPEAIVWNRIAREYKTRFVNDPLRIYRTESDSITAATDIGRNAYSYMLGNRMKLNEQIDYLRHAPIAFLKSAANYVRFSLHMRKNPIDIVASLENQRARLLCLAAFPLGCCVYVRDVRHDR